MHRSTVAIALGTVIVLLSLTVSFSFQWVTANTQGPITYSQRGAGLPLQYVIFEVASPVGPSSYFKVDAFYLLVDFLVWVALAYGALLLLNLPKRRDASAPTA
jgi:hypothetical protein